MTRTEYPSERPGNFPPKRSRVKGERKIGFPSRLFLFLAFMLAVVGFIVEYRIAYEAGLLVLVGAIASCIIAVQVRHER